MEKLPFDFMNAAGWAKTVEQVEMLASIPLLTHIVVGSFTESPREGNVGGTNFDVREDDTSVNSLGLPNKGLSYLKENVGRMREVADDNDKLLVVSIAGADSVEEYPTLARVAGQSAHIVEINAGCPNVYKDGGQKEIISYNLDLLRQVLSMVNEELNGSPQWLKLSPYANPMERVRVAEMINADFQDLDGVVSCNTFANVRLRDTAGNPLLSVTGGRGGMAGSALKEIALTNAEHFCELLPDFDVIGVGGVRTGRDLLDFKRIGCAGIQVGSAFFKDENPRMFTRIIHEYYDIAHRE